MFDNDGGLKVRRFEPVQLTLEGVGPFRHRFELPLTNDDRAPCTFYLIGSRNGFGKTTILQTITGLMWLLGCRTGGMDRNADPKRWLPVDIVDGHGAAQLDARLTVEAGGKTETVLLSICAGTSVPPVMGTKERCGSFGVERWLPLIAESKLTYGMRLSPLYPEDKERVDGLLESIEKAQALGRLPTKLRDHHTPLPTALFFPAERRVYRPPPGAPTLSRPSRLSYDTAHRFANDGETWGDSLEGLFAWFLWEGEERYREARDLINRLMFFEERKRIGNIDRATLTPIVETFDGAEWVPAHPLDRLSHGERAMMQLLLRIAAHVSGGTIVLIDEMEAHLHYRWKRQLMQVLKDWVNESPDMTVIVTTHDPDLIGVFAVDRKEGERLVKGGYLIDENELRGEN